MIYKNLKKQLGTGNCLYYKISDQKKSQCKAAKEISRDQEHAEKCDGWMNSMRPESVTEEMIILLKHMYSTVYIFMLYILLLYV